MARMHPAEPDPDAPASERQLFESLRDDLPPEWTVMHSKRFVLPNRRGGPPIEGEMDFLILDPARGILGLEVKGGREVGRDVRGWYSVDHAGQRWPIKNPGRQAQRGVHALSNWLRDARPVFASGAVTVRFGFGVVFPAADVRVPLGPELPIELIIDRQGVRNMLASVNRLFQAQGISGPALTRGIQNEILDVLAPTVHLVTSLAARLDDESAALVRLTEEQFEILDALSEIPRLAIRGSAGTGKTLVAMERCRRLAGAGKRVLFLCYNKLLADFLAERAVGFTVTNFHSLCREKARSAGIRFEVPSDPGRAQEFWQTEAPESLMRALELYPDERWDAVVVDEGQDFRELWWLAIEKLLKSSVNSSLWVFFDPNQDIFGGGPTGLLGLQAAALSWNCRNTERIASYSARLVGNEPKVRRHAPEGVDVQEIECVDEAAMVDAVRKSLHRLLVEDRLDPKRVVVLSTRGINGSPVWRARTLGNFTLIEHPNLPGSSEVVFSSLQRFKGLEADAIILCDVETDKPWSSERHLYVGSSRARHVLIVGRYARR